MLRKILKNGSENFEPGFYPQTFSTWKIEGGGDEKKGGRNFGVVAKIVITIVTRIIIATDQKIYTVKIVLENLIKN